MWGQVKDSKRVCVILRIIPTRVGTSANGYKCCSPVKDHPHACGDKYVQLLAKICAVGSSPRVWGQASFAYIFPPFNGIIPTRVGTRLIFNKIENKLEDHPHACGDKRKALRRQASRLGSSPRVWGQESLGVLLRKW
mgnify:CR=1 FL=1